MAERTREEWEWYCAWDEEDAKALMGKRVLVGVTYLDEHDNETRQTQYFGTVISVHERDGIRVQCEGSRIGEIEWLPPAPRMLSPAKLGSYRLRSTGEVVEDPDFTTAWISRPGPGPQEPAG
jgi:hypothetical protein